MKEKWILETKKADFNGLSEELGVMPLVIKCMVNRGVESKEQMHQYLNGTKENLFSPELMKGMDDAAELLLEAAKEKQKVAVASDFDCDGIFSGYILWRGFRRLGMDAKIYTPDRVQEGYGLNRRIVDEAVTEGRRVLVTCDNGIAAIEEVDYARKSGMTVIVTDHHEVQECMPNADVVLDPKREDETYPFCELCGAGVAFKFIEALYNKRGIPKDELWEFLPYVAIATVADVMPLRGENRILVKEGLKRLENVDNPGLLALLEVQNLKGKKITAGHIGFIIGPCFNAAGRIATVQESFRLLMEEDERAAQSQAQKLKKINESRKEMTEKGASRAYDELDILEKKNELPDIIVVLLPGIHESLAGIIAGRVKERYNHPTIVFTPTEEGIIKGSGRSVEAYDMFAELMKCKDLMLRFGGHKMAAGMTIKEADLEELRRRLNEQSELEADDFCPVVRIDAAMPVSYVTERLMKEFEQMEPFGIGNSKPVFAGQHFYITKGQRIGKEKRFLKLQVQDTMGNRVDALLFRDADKFDDFIRAEWGENELKRMYEGKENELDVAFTFYPEINEFQGRSSVQIMVESYCRVTGK